MTWSTCIQFQRFPDFHKQTFQMISSKFVLDSPRWQIRAQRNVGFNHIIWRVSFYYIQQTLWQDITVVSLAHLVGASASPSDLQQADFYKCKGLLHRQTITGFYIWNSLSALWSFALSSRDSRAVITYNKLYKFAFLYSSARPIGIIMHAAAPPPFSRNYRTRRCAHPS